MESITYHDILRLYKMTVELELTKYSDYIFNFLLKTPSFDVIKEGSKFVERDSRHAGYGAFGENEWNYYNFVKLKTGKLEVFNLLNLDVIISGNDVIKVDWQILDNFKIISHKVLLAKKENITIQDLFKIQDV